MENMTNDDEIKIKLEVCKDKTSGKLSIMAHFNTDAPNVFQDKDGYFWMPTVEEKDFMSEVFELMPTDAGFNSSEKPMPKPEADKDIKPTPEPEVNEDLKPTPTTPHDKDEETPTNLPQLENPIESTDFEVTDEDIKTDDFVKDIDNKLEEPPDKKDDETTEESKSDETEKKENDEGFIVEADSEAIDAALKKHTSTDETIVEADEQTIIDRVLSQKKKGKWGKR